MNDRIDSAIQPLLAMKVGIMQPYFLPYIGYFQLIATVDVFVVYDDVNFIKQGWVARNRILCNGAEHLLTLRLQGAGSNVLINSITVDHQPRKMLRTIEQSYIKAPEFTRVYPVVEKVISNPERNLATFLYHQIKSLCELMGISTRIVLSSSMEKPGGLAGQDRVLAICERLGASSYINAIGGQALYSKDVFAARGMELSFLQSGDIRYKQFKEPFIPWLSIVDVLMFNDLEQVHGLLGNFKLI
jgi:hypothetical protein